MSALVGAENSIVELHPSAPFPRSRPQAERLSYLSSTRSIAAIAALVGAFGGLIMGEAMRRQSVRHAGYLDGACIALDLTMAHGLMDDLQRRVVTRALSSVSNPYFQEHDTTYRDFRLHCEQLTARR
jgi:hypothetical protein